MTYKILKYPTPENVNPSLFKAIKDENLSMGVGLPPEFPYPCQGAYKTWHFITHNRDKIEGADTLLTWIQKQLPQVAYDFSDGGRYIGGLGYEPNGFIIDRCWGIYYQTADKVAMHDHFPFCMTFVYYVNTPSGCAPTVVEKEEIYPEAGQCLFIPGHVMHGVPETKESGRCIIAGDILYTSPKPNENFYR